MEQSSEEIDVDLYQAHIELRHLPTPDKEPLQGAYFPQEAEKRPHIPTRVVVILLTVGAGCLALLLVVSVVYAMTTI